MAMLPSLVFAVVPVVFPALTIVVTVLERNINVVTIQSMISVLTGPDGASGDHALLPAVPEFEEKLDHVLDKTWLMDTTAPVTPTRKNLATWAMDPGLTGVNGVPVPLPVVMPSEHVAADIPAMPTSMLIPKAATYLHVVTLFRGANGDHALLPVLLELDRELMAGHVITKMKLLQLKYAKPVLVPTHSGPTGAVVLRLVAVAIRCDTGNILVEISMNVVMLMNYPKLKDVALMVLGRYGLITLNALQHAPVEPWSKPDNTNVPM